MKVATYNYLEDKVRFPFGKNTTTGAQRWHMKIWVDGADYDMNVSITPDKRMEFSELIPLIEQQVDEIIEEIPEGANMGWEVWTCR